MALTFCHRGSFSVMILIMGIIALPRVAGKNEVAEMQLNFWRKKLPSVQVPETVTTSMSPLTQEEANTFSKNMKDGNLRLLAFPCYWILEVFQFAVWPVCAFDYPPSNIICRYSPTSNKIRWHEQYIFFTPAVEGRGTNNIAGPFQSMESIFTP